MTDTPDKSLFSVNEREGEYTAYLAVRGEVSFYIKAESRADAEAQARAEIDRILNEGYVEVEDVEDIGLARVSKDQPMFRVTRDGKPMQVSRLDAGDTPRAPDERGF